MKFIVVAKSLRNGYSWDGESFKCNECGNVVSIGILGIGPSRCPKCNEPNEEVEPK